MGQKGDKMTQDSVLKAELITEKLAPLGNITSKRMFGGHGLFHEGKMFGMIDSKGIAYLKVGDSNRESYEKEGSVRHGKMPYYSIPENVFNNQEKLLEWAQIAIEFSKG